MKNKKDWVVFFVDGYCLASGELERIDLNQIVTESLQKRKSFEVRFISKEEGLKNFIGMIGKKEGEPRS